MSSIRSPSAQSDSPSNLQPEPVPLQSPLPNLQPQGEYNFKHHDPYEDDMWNHSSRHTSLRIPKEPNSGVVEDGPSPVSALKSSISKSQEGSSEEPKKPRKKTISFEDEIKEIPNVDIDLTEDQKPKEEITFQLSGAKVKPRGEFAMIPATSDPYDNKPRTFSDDELSVGSSSVSSTGVVNTTNKQTKKKSTMFSRRKSVMKSAPAKLSEKGEKPLGTNKEAESSVEKPISSFFMDTEDDEIDLSRNVPVLSLTTEVKNEPVQASNSPAATVANPLLGLMAKTAKPPAPPPPPSRQGSVQSVSIPQKEEIVAQTLLTETVPPPPPPPAPAPPSLQPTLTENSKVEDANTTLNPIALLMKKKAANAAANSSKDLSIDTSFSSLPVGKPPPPPPPTGSGVVSINQKKENTSSQPPPPPPLPSSAPLALTSGSTSKNLFEETFNRKKVKKVDYYTPEKTGLSAFNNSSTFANQVQGESSNTPQITKVNIQSSTSPSQSKEIGIFSPTLDYLPNSTKNMSYFEKDESQYLMKLSQQEFLFSLRQKIGVLMNHLEVNQKDLQSFVNTSSNQDKLKAINERLKPNKKKLQLSGKNNNEKKDNLQSSNKTSEETLPINSFIQDFISSNQLTLSKKDKTELDDKDQFVNLKEEMIPLDLFESDREDEDQDTDKEDEDEGRLSSQSQQHSSPNTTNHHYQDYLKERQNLLESVNYLHHYYLQSKQRIFIAQIHSLQKIIQESQETIQNLSKEKEYYLKLYEFYKEEVIQQNNQLFQEEKQKIFAMMNSLKTIYYEKEYQIYSIILLLKRKYSDLQNLQGQFHQIYSQNLLNNQEIISLYQPAMNESSASSTASYFSENGIPWNGSALAGQQQQTITPPALLTHLPQELHDNSNIQQHRQKRTEEEELRKEKANYELTKFKFRMNQRKNLPMSKGNSSTFLVEDEIDEDFTYDSEMEDYNSDNERKKLYASLKEGKEKKQPANVHNESSSSYNANHSSSRSPKENHSHSFREKNNVHSLYGGYNSD